MIVIFALVIGILLGFIAGRSHVHHQLQNHGEALVSAAIADAFPSPTYHLLNNLTIPVENGTTQIDHVLVSRYGVFVIETKDYKGWIFANAKSPTWTQVLFKKKYKFQNPLHQNYKHLRAVQALLEFLPSECVKTAVVFVGEGVFRTPRPEGVFKLVELLTYLKGFTTEVMSENRLQFCVGRLECCRLALTHETDVVHRANLQRKFGGKN